MTHDFKVGDKIKHKDSYWAMGQIVEMSDRHLVLNNATGIVYLNIYNLSEFVKDDIATEAVHTPINYKNEYHRLLEDNQVLNRHLCDAYASKEAIHSFYCDDFYLRNRIIAFLCAVVALETIFLIWGLL